MFSHVELVFFACSKSVADRNGQLGSAIARSDGRRRHEIGRGAGIGRKTLTPEGE